MKISSYEFGDPNGATAVFFHGFPGSGKEAEVLDDDAKIFGYRVFSFDRPGYGDTEIYRDLSTADFYTAILQKIPAGPFHVIGISGGGPYAIDFATRFADRAQSLTLVCALSSLKTPEVLQAFEPKTQRLLKIFSTLPYFAQNLVFKTLSALRPDAGRFLKDFSAQLPPRDQLVFEDTGFFKIFENALKVSKKQAFKGAARDLRFYLQFEPSKDISKTIKIRIYHGEKDTIVPLESSSCLMKIWPHAEFKIYPGESHFSMPVFNKHEILKEPAYFSRSEP